VVKDCKIRWRNKKDAVDYSTHNHFTDLFLGRPGEPVPEENFWTVWCKGISTAAGTPTIRLGATASGLSSAHLHHPPHIFTGRMLFLPDALWTIVNGGN